MQNKNMMITAMLTMGTLLTITMVSASATVSIADWYPQGSNYVFTCENNIDATSYDWNFGDGQYMYDISNSDVYHTYTANGTLKWNCNQSTIIGALTTGGDNPFIGMMDDFYVFNIALNSSEVMMLM